MHREFRDAYAFFPRKYLWGIAGFVAGALSMFAVWCAASALGYELVVSIPGF
jgi:hypothetical protein